MIRLQNVVYKIFGNLNQFYQSKPVCAPIKLQIIIIVIADIDKRFYK